MKNRILTTLLALLIVLINKAQLSGIATLNGQSDHSGIKVKFIAAAATSITDSTYTNSSGTYSFNISGGLYKIEFSKVGFQSVYYANNTISILTNTTVLNNVALNPGNIVNVSGDVSGVWSSKNIYVVQNHLSIPFGKTLSIEPGTVIKFNGNYTLTANGVLKAIGMETNRIVFTSNITTPAAGNWGGIVLTSTQNQIKNCLFEYFINGINVPQGNATIEENEFRYFTGGAVGFNIASPSLVKNNLIHDFTHIAIGSYAANIQIECNTIYNGNGAMGIGDNSLIKNNHIYNMTGNAITCYYNSNARIENNIVHNSGAAIVFGENVGIGPKPLIINNTLFSNTIAIYSRGFFGGASIVGNIISDNNKGIYQAPYSSATPYVITHNLFWNNSVSNFADVQIFGLGQIVNTNTNGDPVDSYYNLYIDPLFNNNTAPYLASNSPCLNAGDANYSSNIGCNPSNMCSSMILGAKEIDKNPSALAFPNPFVSNIRINGLKNSTVSAARFYDLSGKMFEASYELNHVSELTVKAEDLHPGVYFLEIVFSNSSKTYLRVIKE